MVGQHRHYRKNTVETQKIFLAQRPRTLPEVKVAFVTDDGWGCSFVVRKLIY